MLHPPPQAPREASWRRAVDWLFRNLPDPERPTSRHTKSRRGTQPVTRVSWLAFFYDIDNAIALHVRDPLHRSPRPSDLNVLRSPARSQPEPPKGLARRGLSDASGGLIVQVAPIGQMNVHHGPQTLTVRAPAL